MEFIYFSFIQGVLAFLAPCAVALLPGYVSVFISRDSQYNLAISRRLFRGLKLALLSTVGILMVYTIAGSLILVAAQILKVYMKWIAMGMGILLIVMGIFMVAGKDLSFSINMNNPTKQTEAVEALMFGIAYAIGALGCLFPLFLVVATQAMAAPSLWLGISYITAYFAGISGMMIGTILISSFAKNWLIKYLHKILPYMERITGGLLIIAGTYIIYYQSALI